MPETINIKGHKDYFMNDGKIYRRVFKVRHSRFVWQYFSQRQIKRTMKDGAVGYFLKGKFIPEKKLLQRLEIKK